MSSPRASSGHSRLRILAYHAIADMRDDPVLAEYAVPPALFAAHLDGLLARGWSFVDLDTALAAFAGEGTLPRRAALLTFDDGYVDLLDVAVPLLRERGIPAVVFAIAGHIGGVNDWEHHRGAASLSLLDSSGLREVSAAGIEVGSHTTSHRALPEVPEAEVEGELESAADQLEAAGLPRPRAFSYPYGRWTPELAAAVREAGYEVAFTTAWGLGRPGVDRCAVPRIEIHASDTSRKLRLKLALAGWPGPLRDSLLTLAGVRLDPSSQ